MNSTKIRVIGAVLSLQRFAVVDLCEHTSLSRSQVDPVLRKLKTLGFLVQVDENRSSDHPAHRPPGAYELTKDIVKRQDLANELYRVKRAITPLGMSDNQDLQSTNMELDHLDLLLLVCEKVSENEPWSCSELQKIERQLQTTHKHLEVATFRRGLDLRKPANNEHPLRIGWLRWQKYESQLHQIINKWECGKEVASFTAPLLKPVREEERVVISSRPSLCKVEPGMYSQRGWVDRQMSSQV